MNERKFESALESLRQYKTNLTNLSTRPEGRHVMNTLIQAIKETLSHLEGIKVPDEMAATKQKVVNKIRQAAQSIDSEYTGVNSTSTDNEVITEQTSRQVNVIRDALKEFDGKGLEWLG